MQRQQQKAAFISGNATQYAQIQQRAVTIARSDDNPLNGLRLLQFIPKGLDFPNSVEDGSSSDSNTSFTLRLAYNVNENVNVYGSYATGFKATSWNLWSDSRPFPKDYTTSSTIRDPYKNNEIVSAAASSPIRDATDITVPNNLTTGTRYAAPEEAKVIELGVKASFDDFRYAIAIFDQTIEGCPVERFYWNWFFSE